MSITDKLQQLNTIKADIKTAINSKGGNVGDDFTTYATAINNIETGGTEGGGPITIQPSYGSAFNDNSIDKGSLLIIDCSRLTTIRQMFNKTQFFDEIAPKIINTENITDISNLLTSSNLKMIQLFNTSNVTNMSNVFNYCSNLVQVPQFDTSKATKMLNMFRECKSLVSIPQFDTSNVEDMNYMFYGCTNLETIPLLDASKITVNNLNRTFYLCPKLTNVGGLKNLSVTLELPDSPLLTRESVLNIFNNLATVTTKTYIYLHSDVKARLTDADIAIATSKGWVIA